jgi:hypothetical protein
LIHGNPELSRHYPHEGGLGLIGFVRLDPAKTVGNTMDMNVNADSGYTKTKTKNEICRLSADAGKGNQLFHGGRNRATVLFGQYRRNGAQIFRLGAIEPGRIDQLFYLFPGYVLELQGCVCPAQKAFACRKGDFIPGTQTDNGRDKDVKRIGQAGFGDNPIDTGQVVRPY